MDTDHFLELSSFTANHFHLCCCQGDLPVEEKISQTSFTIFFKIVCFGCTTKSNYEINPNTAVDQYQKEILFEEKGDTETIASLSVN